MEQCAGYSHSRLEGASRYACQLIPRLAAEHQLDVVTKFRGEHQPNVELVHVDRCFTHDEYCIEKLPMVGLLRRCPARMTKRVPFVLPDVMIEKLYDSNGQHRAEDVDAEKDEHERDLSLLTMNRMFRCWRRRRRVMTRSIAAHVDGAEDDDRTWNETTENVNVRPDEVEPDVRTIVGTTRLPVDTESVRVVVEREAIIDKEENRCRIREKNVAENAFVRYVRMRDSRMADHLDAIEIDLNDENNGDERAGIHERVEEGAIEQFARIDGEIHRVEPIPEKEQ